MIPKFEDTSIFTNPAPQEVTIVRPELTGAQILGSLIGAVLNLFISAGTVYLALGALNVEIGGEGVTFWQAVLARMAIVAFLPHGNSWQMWTKPPRSEKK